MCGECGNFTLVRNGTCLKCDTCGSDDGVFVIPRLVMAGLDPAIHDFKGRPKGRPFCFFLGHGTDLG